MSQFLPSFSPDPENKDAEAICRVLSLLQICSVITQNPVGYLYDLSNLCVTISVCFVVVFYQDLLRCRVLTSGIFETRFQVDKVNFQ